MKKQLSSVVFRKLGVLYEDMQSEYVKTAKMLNLSCENCEQNCCTSYFQHHTYVEWAYMHKGIQKAPEEHKQLFRVKAQEYVQKAQAMLQSGQRPNLMCPLNIDGLCGLYTHRLMICRLHGVPNRFTSPKGQVQHFLGCFKSQAIIENMTEVPVLDRTELYKRLVHLEMELLGPKKIRSLPRVNLTLAEMIVAGPPQI